MPLAGVRRLEKHPGFESQPASVMEGSSAFERGEGSGVEQEDVALRPLKFDAHSLISVQVERAVDEFTHGV